MKQLIPIIPETNIYGKVFPLRREANIRKKVYREAVSKMLPPVEERELSRLESLVTGELDMPVVKRRSRPQGQGEMDQGEVKRREVLSKVDRHYITKQFRRRLYTQILAESPRLLYVKGQEVEGGNDEENEDKGESDDGENEDEGGSDDDYYDDDERGKRAVKVESRRMDRWKVQFSPLGRGKKPVVGLEEEFDEDEEDRIKNVNSGGRGTPGLVGRKRKEKMKGNV